MEKTQFILPYIGSLTINNEYRVTLTAGQALEINWFPDNDLIVETATQKYYFNTTNTEQIAPGRYLIKLLKKENRANLPVKFARGSYLVADNVVIDRQNKTYFTADNLDILPDEIVAAHGDRVTRVLFAGDKSAVEHYVKAEPKPQ